MQRWREVVCIASGPSLTADDCERVRRWRSEATGRGVIVTNTTYQRCPWADVLYALDEAWWKKYKRKARGTFSGELVTPHRVHGVRRETAWLNSDPTNSGAAAMAQAAWWNADRIILLGYDCQHTGGRKHWHPDHPGKLGNADGVADWPAQFAAILPRLRGIEIINASRETALALFPRASLEEALALPAPAAVGGIMRQFTKSFRGVRRGEIYPVTFKAGDDCPRELEAAAEVAGALEPATDPVPTPPPVRRGRKARGK